MTEPSWAVQPTAIRRTFVQRIRLLIWVVREFGFSDSGCFLVLLSFRPRDCDPTTYEIRVNANLPDDDLQAGYCGRALRTR
jgi:hypothetical protein